MTTQPRARKILLATLIIFLAWLGISVFHVKVVRAAPAYVQSALLAVTSSSAISVSFSSAPTAGNLVAVAVSSYVSGSSGANVAGLITSVTDNQGNIYYPIGVLGAEDPSPGYELLNVYYAKNVTSTGGTFTVTVHFRGSGVQGTAAIEEISGADTAAPFDQVTTGIRGSNLGINIAQISTPNITSYYSQEYFFAAQMHYNTIASTTVAGSFTQRQDQEDLPNTESLSIADMTSGATTTNVVFNYAGGTSNAVAMAMLILFKTGASRSGYLDSSTFDTGVASGTALNSVNWEGTQPAGTAVKFQFAVSNSSSGPWNYEGPDGTINTYYNPSAGATQPLSYTLFNNFRYFRYRVTLYSDTSGISTPQVTDIDINWSP